MDPLLNIRFYTTDVERCTWHNETHFQATLTEMQRYLPLACRAGLIDFVIYNMIQQPIVPEQWCIMLYTNQTILASPAVGHVCNWDMNDSLGFVYGLKDNERNRGYIAVTLQNIIRSIRRKRQKVLVIQWLMLMELYLTKHILFEFQVSYTMHALLA